MALRKVASAVLSIGVIIAGLAPATAVNAITLVESSMSVNGNGTITLVATQPLAGAGVFGQTLVHHFDNSKFRLTDVSQIVAPAGWTIQYSSDDGVTWSADTPGNAAEWAAVNAVKATGTLDTSGSNGNNQVATQAAQGISAASSPFLPHANGDGWEAFPDTKGYVWNVFHHDGDGNQQALDCHLRTSAPCGAAYPLRFAQFGWHTSNRPYLYIDEATSRIFMPTSCSNVTGTPCGANDGVAGVACIDVSDLANPAPCAGLADGFLPLGSSGQNQSDVSGLAVAGGKLYAFNQGSLMCMAITATPVACPGSPYSISANGTATTLADNEGELADLIDYGSKIYGVAGDDTGNPAIFCWDPTSNSLCSGWSTAKQLRSDGDSSTKAVLAKLFGIKDSAGNWAGICTITAHDPSSDWSYGPIPDQTKCFNPAGTVISTPTWVSGTVKPNLMMSNTRMSNGPGELYGMLVQTNELQWSGTRVYWAVTGEAPDSNSAKYYCYDVSLASICPNWPVTRSHVWLGYTIHSDPLNVNCLWTNVDTGGILPIDAITGQAGCTSTPGMHADFVGNSVLPRMGCSVNGVNPLASYGSIQMTGPVASGSFTLPKLTVLDSTGLPVAGWSHVAPTGTVNGMPSWDASSLSPSVTGANPTLQLDFSTYASTTFATMSVSGVSSPAQLCITPAALPQCGPQGFFSNSTPLSAATASFRAEGSVTTNGGTTAIPGETVSATISAPSATDCQANLIGQTWEDGSLTGNWTNITDVTVTLADSAGNPVLGADHLPVTALVGSDGSFAFDGLVPGNYRVIFPDSTNSANSATNVHKTSIGTGQTLNSWHKIWSGDNTTTVSAPSLTTSPVPVAVGTPGIVFGYYLPGPIAPSRTDVGPAGTPLIFDPFATVGSSSAASPTPSSSFTGVNSIPVLGCPPAANPCSATSVTIPNQGTYSVDTNSKQITFTPLAAFTGTATAVQYSIIDQAGNAAQGTLTPTLFAVPHAVPDAITTAWDVSQSYTPSANDSQGLDASTLKLCGPTQTPNNCTLTSLTVPNVGTYSVTNGVVAFDPLSSFAGTAAAVTYQISTGGANPMFTSSTITPTITPPVIAATPQVLSNLPGPGKSVTYTALDTGASALANSTAPLDSSQTCLFLVASPSQCSTSVTSEHGTFILDRQTGVVTFTSAAGVALNDTYSDQIGYRAYNTFGQSADSTLAVNTAALTIAKPDALTTKQGEVQTYSPLSNDVLDTGVSLVASSLKLCAPNATICDQTSLNVPGEGLFEVQPDGSVTFTPDGNFVGKASSVRYSVTDSLGRVAFSTITPTVLPGDVLAFTGVTLPPVGFAGAGVVVVGLFLLFARRGVRK